MLSSLLIALLPALQDPTPVQPAPASDPPGPPTATAPLKAPLKVPLKVQAEQAVVTTFASLLTEGPLRAESWLVIDAVDGRGRRPVRPDAVFAAHLLDPNAPRPQSGQALTGERGEQTWSASEVAENGGPVDSGGYAYGRVVAPTFGVYMAKLTGAWQLYVNGRPHTGDAYRYGFPGVPVDLLEGPNDVHVTGGRGSFGLTFEPAEHAIFPGAFDMTVPDLVAGEEQAEVLVGLPLFSCSTEWLPGVAISVSPSSAFEPDFFRPLATALAPLTVANVPLTLRLREGVVPVVGENLSLELFVTWEGAERPLLVRRDLRVVERTAPRLVTFRSAIDDSIQEYGLREPLESSRSSAGLVVSLHGASVATRNQINAYSSKPDHAILTPTNRRPYGFDWQDWGREDVYECIEHYGAHDTTRRYLTGHSMGGHGTWHVAANDPDYWAAIAPSAGWQSFDTYGSRPEGALRDLWHTADSASRTIDKIAALAELPTFILHGDADSTVPVSEAREMERLLREAGAENLSVHYEPGAGHWWDGDRARGADCVDWPGIWELFETVRREPGMERGPSALAHSFKRAYSNGFVLVVGTAGDAAMDEALLDQARYDALSWSYRARGRAPLVTDEEFLEHPELFEGRNWLLYGNRVNNLAWQQALAGTQAPANWVTGSSSEDTAMGLTAEVFERPGKSELQVSLWRSASVRAARLHSTLAHFVSGAGVPSHFQIDSDVLREGDDGVVSAGWRGADGQIGSNPLAFSEDVQPRRHLPPNGDGIRGYGAALAAMPSADGVARVAVGSPWAGAGGFIECYAFPDEDPLWVAEGVPDETLGRFIVAVEDQDEDGVPDLYTRGDVRRQRWGASASARHGLLLSGATGERLSVTDYPGWALLEDTLGAPVVQKTEHPERVVLGYVPGGTGAVAPNLTGVLSVLRRLSDAESTLPRPLAYPAGFRVPETMGPGPDEGGEIYQVRFLPGVLVPGRSEATGVFMVNGAEDLHSRVWFIDPVTGAVVWSSRQQYGQSPPKAGTPAESATAWTDGERHVVALGSGSLGNSVGIYDLRDGELSVLNVYGDWEWDGDDFGAAVAFLPALPSDASPVPRLLVSSPQTPGGYKGDESSLFVLEWTGEKWKLRTWATRS